MAEGGKDIQIKIDPVIDAKPKNPLEAFRSYLAGKKITILPQGEAQVDDLADVIKISETLDEGPEITLLDQAEEGIEIGIEPAMRLAVSAQTNRESAQTFFSSLRVVTPELLGDARTQQSYIENQWYSAADVTALAEIWNIPICLVRNNGDHWILALRAPEHTGYSYRVLAYDPMKGGETWFQLPGYKGSYETADMWGSGIFTNTGALNQLKSGEYNLSIYGDMDMADNEELNAAKMTMVQLGGDGSNCGPACLFMAALREGVKPGWNGFKFAGRDSMEAATGLKVYLREEILAEK